MTQGAKTVVWFDGAKDFGSLTRKSGPDIFCQFNAIQADSYTTQDDRAQTTSKTTEDETD